MTNPLPPTTTKKEARNNLFTSLGAFGLSVLLHIAVLVTVGGYVIMEGMIPKTTFLPPEGMAEGMDAEVLEPEMEHSPELSEPSAMTEETVPTTSSTAAGDSTPADILVSTGINRTFSLPPAVGPPSAKLGGAGTQLGSGGVSEGAAQPSKSPGIRTATIFGKQVEAGTFGVIFDVSFSTHAFMDLALGEIEKGFPDALVVLAPGCGIFVAEPKGKVLPGRDFIKDLPTYTNPGVHYEMSKFLPKLLETNKNFNRMWEKTNRDQRMFVLFLEPEVNPKTGKPNSNSLLNGNRLAFDFLIEKDVDTIYWLADFQDVQNKTFVAELAGRLKKKGIRVIQHDVAAPAALPEKTILSDVTGGKFIYHEPLKK